MRSPLKTLCTLIAAAAGVALAAGPVTAAPASSDFYAVPSSLTGQPGDLIRHEPSHLALAVPNGGGGTFPATATRIMYRSTSATGRPNAVTGTVLTPTLPWRGTSPRPLISLGVGTHGQGDQCAPSHLLNETIHYRPLADLMLEYEIVAMYTLLAQGMSVVVTDYEGLGTPGVHTYLNTVAEGRAMIDAARAAQNLPGKTGAAGPVAFFGYSQGGGAAAGAAEQAGTYGKGLDVRGTFVGAAPTDLSMLLGFADGTSLTGLLGMYLNGLAAAYPETGPVIDGILNAEGRQALGRLQNMCAVESTLNYGFRKTSSWTKSGRSFQAELDANPITREAIRSQRMGGRRPSAPVLMTTASADDIVPAQGVRDTARNWKRLGADVTLDDNPIPTILPGTGVGHVLNYPASILGQALSWTAQRVGG